MDEHVDPLCCCEYFDRNDERNHILACCCNCVDLDESFTSLVGGRSIAEQNKHGLMATLQDRLRIPWRGGAKQIAFDSILPIFVLPLMLLLSSLSLWWTIFTFTTVLVFMARISSFFITHVPKTKFFYMWTLTSIVTLYIIFELIVIPFLEILVEENIVLTIIIGSFLLCLYLTKTGASHLAKTRESEAESGAVGKSTRPYNCSVCQVVVPDGEHHCFWYDCCIGRHNQCLYILSLFFAVAALLYSSDLTLTAVCHPFKFYSTILLPDDCSEVYEQFELALSFVTALYSLGLAMLLFIIFIHQLWIVSIGLTGSEWKKLSTCAKLCLGLTAMRPHNRGFKENWSRILCYRKSQYSPLIQLEN